MRHPSSSFFKCAECDQPIEPTPRIIRNRRDGAEHQVWVYAASIEGENYCHDHWLSARYPHLRRLFKMMRSRQMEIRRIAVIVFMVCQFSAMHIEGGAIGSGRERADANITRSSSRPQARGAHWTQRIRITQH